MDIETERENASMAETEWRAEALSVAESLGYGYWFRDKTALTANELIWHLGLCCISEATRKPNRMRRRKRGNAVGRPKKKLTDMKPVQLYIRVWQLKEFFEKTAGTRISNRAAIKYLIEWNEIPYNSHIGHIEKQVSAGKRLLMEATNAVEMLRDMRPK